MIYLRIILKSTTTARSAVTRTGLPSIAVISGISSTSFCTFWRVSASGPTALGASPRTPLRMTPTLVSLIISEKSSVGRMRMVVSRITSVYTPPVPNTMTRPKFLSEFTPMMVSVALVIISWMSTEAPLSWNFSMEPQRPLQASSKEASSAMLR